MLNRIIDWYLARHGYKRVRIDEAPIVLTREVPVEIVREVEVRVEVPVPQYPVPRLLIDVAKELELHWELTDISGEAKRHQVYARMIKLFPAEERQDIALAIEYGLRELDG